MGPHEVIIFSSVLIVAVSAAGYCSLVSEVDRLIDAIAECESNITPFYAVRFLNDMSNERLTFEQFVEELHPFCEKPSHTLTCLSENVRAHEDCRDYEPIQTLLTMRTMRWYMAKFLCENNATRYLDLAVNDGPRCYTNNNLHRDCTSQPKHEKIAFNRAALSNSHVCSFLGVNVYCLSSYDNCENQNVRLHIGNMSEQLQSHFGCLES